MRRVEPEEEGDDVVERFMYWPTADTNDGDTKEQCTYEANGNDIEPEQLVGQWCYLRTDSISGEEKKWKITSQVQPHSNSHHLALDSVLWQVDGPSGYALAEFKKPRDKIIVDLQMTISSAYMHWRLCGYTEF